MFELRIPKSGFEQMYEYILWGLLLGCIGAVFVCKFLGRTPRLCAYLVSEVQEEPDRLSFHQKMEAALKM